MTDQDMFRRYQLEEWQIGQCRWQQEAPGSVYAAMRGPGPGPNAHAQAETPPETFL